MGRWKGGRVLASHRDTVNGKSVFDAFVVDIVKIVVFDEGDEMCAVNKAGFKFESENRFIVSEESDF